MYHCKMWKKKHHSICIFLGKITYVWVHIGTKSILSLFSLLLQKNVTLRIASGMLKSTLFY